MVGVRVGVGVGDRVRVGVLVHDAHAADALDEAVERAAVRALLGLLTPLDDLVRVRASVRARARASHGVRVRVASLSKAPG